MINPPISNKAQNSVDKPWKKSNWNRVLIQTVTHHLLSSSLSPAMCILYQILDGIRTSCSNSIFFWFEIENPIALSSSTSNPFASFNVSGGDKIKPAFRFFSISEVFINMLSNA